MNPDEITGYRWASAALTPSHDYLLPALLREAAALRVNGAWGGRVFELGCGNGSVAGVLAQQGWDVTGVDPPARASRRPMRSGPSSSFLRALPMTTWRRVMAAFRW